MGANHGTQSLQCARLFDRIGSPSVAPPFESKAGDTLAIPTRGDTLVLYILNTIIPLRHTTMQINPGDQAKHVDFWIVFYLIHFL